jgi:hypothetical protein
VSVAPPRPPGRFLAWAQDEVGTWLPAFGAGLIFWLPGWWRLAGFAVWLALGLSAVETARRAGDSRRLVFGAAALGATALVAVDVFATDLSRLETAILWVPLLGCFGLCFVLARHEWLQVVSWREVGRFAVWCGTLAAAEVAATVLVVHQAERRTSASASFPYVTGRGFVAVVAIMLVAAVGGLTVFRSRTSWAVLVVALPIGGLVPWMVLGWTFTAIGALKPDGVGGLCVGGHHDCTQFAYVAGFAVAASPFTVAAAFAAAFAVRRLPAVEGTRRRT